MLDEDKNWPQHLWPPRGEAGRQGALKASAWTVLEALPWHLYEMPGLSIAAAQRATLVGMSFRVRGQWSMGQEVGR